MQSSTHASLRAFLLVLLMLVAPLSGCFGETEEPETVNLEVALTIDGQAPSTTSAPSASTAPTPAAADDGKEPIESLSWGARLGSPTQAFCT